MSYVPTDVLDTSSRLSLMATGVTIFSYISYQDY